MGFLRRLFPIQNVGTFLTTSDGRTFLWLWLAEAVSTFGSNLTAFALGIYLYQRTGEATPLALSVLAGYLPAILLGPFAGVIVDRVDRKWAMVLSDAGQALTTLALLVLIASGTFSPALIYVLLAVGSAAGTLQYPAAAATVSLLVPPAHLGRANGLLSLAEGMGSLFAPVLAGFLIVGLGISGVMVIDVATFVFSALVLLRLRLPRPPREAPQPGERRPLWPEIRAGWTYIAARRGLLGLLLIGAALNLIGIFVTARLNTPLVLARTDGDTAALGVVAGAFGLGMLLGGVGMATWGGPTPRIYGALGGIAALGLSYQVLFGLGHTVPVWALASFLGGLLIPVQSGSANAIWQAKVPPAVQGRVFAVRRTVGQLLAPVGLLLIGPLADQVAAPWLQTDTGQRLSPLLGTGPGANFALILCLCGGLSALLALLALALPQIRGIEADLPDAVGAGTLQAETPQ
jgi:MFS family permease